MIKFAVMIFPFRHFYVHNKLHVSPYTLFCQLTVHFCSFFLALHRSFVPGYLSQLQSNSDASAAGYGSEPPGSVKYCFKYYYCKYFDHLCNSGEKKNNCILFHQYDYPHLVTQCEGKLCLCIRWRFV